MRKYYKPIVTLLAAAGFYSVFGILFPLVIGIPDQAQAISPAVHAFVVIATGALVIKAIYEASKIKK